MNVPQEDLDLWRKFFERLKATMFDVNRQMAAGNATRAKALVMDTASAAARMGVRLEQAGAQRPPEMPPRRETPLELLDTPANRRLLQALLVAHGAMLEVDRERYGEGIGMDGEAQVLEMLIAEKHLEIHGPARDETKVR